MLLQFSLSAKRCCDSPYLFVSHTFWIMMVKGPSIWKPRAKYMTLHHPSTRAKDMGTTSPVVLVRRITMVTRIMQAYVMLPTGRDSKKKPNSVKEILVKPLREINPEKEYSKENGESDLSGKREQWRK